MKSFLRCFFSALVLGLTTMAPAAVAGKPRPERIFGMDRIVEACLQAERENLPLCFCLLRKGVPGSGKEIFPGMETAWREAITQLSGECLVIEGKEPENNWWLFARLLLRTQAAKPSFAFTGIALVDPLQESALSTALIEPDNWADPDGKKQALPNFKADVAKMLKAAATWKAAHALKAETWTDAKNRIITATAVSWDGKNAILRLQNGKAVSLSAATLSPASLTRLAQLFPALLPVVNASDSKALAACVGQEVWVVGKEAALEIVSEGGREAGNEGVRLFHISPLFGIKYDPAMEQTFGISHPGGGWPCLRMRVRGVLQKETATGFASKQYQYFIKITEARQLGPGPLPD